MKRFRFLRRRNPVSGLSWHFEENPSDRPDAGLSWHFEEHASDRPDAGLSWHFEEAVRDSAPTDIASSIAAAHISAAAEAAGVEPVTNSAQAVSSLRATIRKRRLVLGGLLSSVTAKVLLGTMTALAATGGAAAANVLPDPVQAVVSDVAGAVGIDLPSPDDDDAAIVMSDEEEPVDNTRDLPGVDDADDDDGDLEGDDADDDDGDLEGDDADDDDGDLEGDDEGDDDGDLEGDDADDDDGDLEGDDEGDDDQGDDDQGDDDQGGDDQGGDDQGDDEG